MNETKWLTTDNPSAMLRYLKGKAGERKLRLFAVAVNREYDRIEPQFDSPESRRAVEAAEAFAEEGRPVDDATRKKLRGYFILNPTAFGAAKRMVDIPDVPAAFKCALLRCLLGNPFRPVVIQPAWRTPAVLSLARGVHEDRAFDRLPILGDALEEAGCEEEAVLLHCRGGPHALGCWVVDLLLEKE